MIVGLVCWLPAPLAAQISFGWETRRQDTLYQTVEECLGLLSQVWGRTVEWDTIAQQLIPSAQRVANNTVHDTVTTVALHCSQKFSLDDFVASASTDPTRSLNAVSLLIKAKRDDDALALVERWTAKLPEADDSLRAFIREQVFQYFLDDKPTRFAAIRRLADSLDFTKFWEQQIIFYGKLMERARALKDTAELDRTVAWLLAVNQRTSDSLKQLPEWPGRQGAGLLGIGGFKRGPGNYILDATTYSQRVALLEKLRHSTASYLDFLDVLRKDAGFKEPMRDQALAEPIIAEYWLPEKSAADRPARGKVSVVLSLPGNECNPCWYREGWMGRVAQRFPEVEFTLLVRTHGSYNRYFSTLSPADEARLVDSIHRQVYGFPGSVAVHETQWWRFEEPYDRRVVEEQGPNNRQYPVFGIMSVTRIIDRNGRFIPNISFSLDPDESMVLLFEALMNQATP